MLEELLYLSDQKKLAGTNVNLSVFLTFFQYDDYAIAYNTVLLVCYVVVRVL